MTNFRKTLQVLAILLSLVVLSVPVWADDSEIANMTRLRLKAIDDELVVVDTSTGLTKKTALSDFVGLAYYPDSTVADQGAVSATADRSVYDLIAIIGSNNAQLVFQHYGSGSTTYTFSTTEVIDSNITCVIQPGAILSISTGVTLTIYSPEHLKLGKRQYAFACTGTGAVAFSKAGVVYSDRWGENTTPGTTDMTAEVQAAIDSVTTNAGIVQLAPETYACDKISMKSNVCLVGSGWNTIIDATPTNADTAQIECDGIANAQIRNLKLDGQSASGTVNKATCGILIKGGSTEIIVENVFIYDAYYIPLHVRTSASDITIDNVVIHEGGLSTGMLIGIYTAETGNVRNINVSNLTVRNMYGNGIGVWSPGTGETENVNITNLVIRSVGEGAAGHAIVGSTDAKNVQISNFVIDTTANNGHGMQLEAIDTWEVSNGSIKDVVGGYGINATGDVKRSNFSNITIVGCATRGLLVGTTANDNNFSNITVDGSGNGAIIGGVRNSVVNCKFIDDTFGGDGDGVIIQYDAEDLIFANSQICATGAGTTGSGVVFGTIVSVTMKNNRVTGTITTPVKGGGSKVTAETISVSLPSEDYANNEAYEVPILMLPATQNYYLISAYLTFGANITQDDTDYNTYTIKKRDSAGNNVVSVTTGITTKIAGGSAFNDFVAISLPIANQAYANVAGGYGISLAKAVAGVGQAEADGLLTINYVTY